MIVFPNKYPYEITNATGGTICGIAPAGTLNLGPQYMDATIAFYAQYAELAFSYLLDGSLTAKDASGSALVAYLAASSFTNMRAQVTNYEPGARVYQTYTKFADRISVPGFFAGDGSTGSPGQSIVQGSSGLLWDQGSLAYRNTFSSDSLVAGVLSVTHDLDSDGFICQVYDNNNKQVIPTDIQQVDTNSLNVDLTGMTVTGTWSVIVLASGKPIAVLPSSGPTGAMGQRGETGASIQGVTGLSGAQGQTGVQGLIGLQGATGLVGPVGATGVGQTPYDAVVNNGTAFRAAMESTTVTSVYVAVTGLLFGLTLTTTVPKRVYGEAFTIMNTLTVGGEMLIRTNGLIISASITVGGTAPLYVKRIIGEGTPAINYTGSSTLIYETATNCPITGTGASQGFWDNTARGVLGANNLTISATAPSSPAVGDVWIDIS